MRCPACATQNPEDALVCTMCKRVLRKASDRPPPPEPGHELHHTIELGGDRPRAIELADRPRRTSERPAPLPDSPGTNPGSARTISYRPPPPSAPAEISLLERALDRIARPYDALVWTAVRTPAERRDGASGTTRGGVILQALGSALVMAIAWWIGRDVGLSPIVPALLGVLAAISAISARAWIGRSWDRDADPSPIATIGVTWLPSLVVAAIAVVGTGALIGGFRRPAPDAAIEVTASGRLLIALAAMAYATMALAAALRDRVRASREARERISAGRERRTGA